MVGMVVSTGTAIIKGGIMITASGSCLYCGGLIMEPGKSYLWGGPVCHCVRHSPVIVTMPRLSEPDLSILRSSLNDIISPMQFQINRLTVENDRLREDAQRLYQQYIERGMAMKDTGDMVRSIYAPKNEQLNKENGKLKGRIKELEEQLNALEEK